MFPLWDCWTDLHFFAAERNETFPFRAAILFISHNSYFSAYEKPWGVAWAKNFSLHNKKNLQWKFCGIPGVFNPLTPGAFCQKRIFWTFWRFSGWIWAKLAPMYLKRHLHWQRAFLPLASRFMTFLLGHVRARLVVTEATLLVRPISRPKLCSC